MENIFHVADCCRACLRIECSLTPTSAADNDSIKFCDKLVTCVSEVMWLKEGLPSLICSTCIEKLRVAYEFRNVCLQSDQTLQRYISHLQEEAEQQNITGRPLTTPTKFEFTIPQVTQESLPCIIEEPQNAEYLYLKHLIDNDQEMLKSEQIIDTQTSRSTTPDQRNPSNFITQDHHIQPIVQDIETQVQESYIQENDQLVQHKQESQLLEQLSQIHQSPQDEEEPQLEKQQQQNHQQQQQEPVRQSSQFTLQQFQLRQVIKRMTGVQIQATTPSSAETHSGEKPYDCKYCAKKFYHYSHLGEHIRWHTGERPLECTVCYKRFTIIEELTVHMRIHTGEKS